MGISDTVDFALALTEVDFHVLRHQHSDTSRESAHRAGVSEDQLAKAVALIDGRALVEISGGVKRGNLAALAACGADIISVGALTHGATAVDISMRIESTQTSNDAPSDQ